MTDSIRSVNMASLESFVKQITLKDALVAAGVTILLRVVYLIIYRTYFHPLVKFPGPPGAQLSDLWTVWYSWKGQSHLKSLEAHEKYGPIVRFGPNKLSISSVTAIEAVYRGTATLKSDVYATINPKDESYSTFTSIDRAMHRRKRKVFGQAFSEAAIRGFEPKIQRHSEIFVDLIVQAAKESPNGWSEPLNMTPRARFMATDVMGEFGFGKSFDMQTSTENHFLIPATDGATVVAGMYCQYPKLRKYGLGRLVALAGVSTKEKFGRLSQHLINERLKDTTGTRNDLLHYVSNSEGKDAQLVTMDEVWAESRFTLIAGAETTGTAIAATLFYLSRTPDALARLQKEIRNTFTSTSEIKLGTTLSSCTFLWACIDEAMRLSPSVVAVLWRQTIVDGFSIDGEVLPKGIDLGFTSYVPHHNSEIFPKPFQFQPDRWLPSKENDAATLEMRRKAFAPFGLGPRKCIGIRMAYSEIALSVSKIMLLLDLKRPADPVLDKVGCGKPSWDGGREKEGEFQLYEHVTTRHDGPYLQYSLRKD